jgi:hypothetical protein
MTELQWLIHMLTKQKLAPKIKDMFIARIGDVEQRLSPQRPAVNPLVQAPSAQRLLDQQVNPVIPDVPAKIIVPQEVITGKGNGTSIKGPRKW